MPRSAICYFTDRLRPEIRREILEHVLTKPKPIEFAVTYPLNEKGKRDLRYVVTGHQRNASHLGQIFDATTRKWVPAPPRATALLMVCKLLHAEAEEVLYGCNTFKFLNTAGLTSFMATFSGPAYAIKRLEIFHYVAGSAKQFWLSLLPLVNLRQLVIGHSGLRLHGPGVQGPRPAPLVKHMTPLPRVLKHSYSARGLTANPADVLVIEMQDCNACSCKCGKTDRKSYCDCECDEDVSGPKVEALFRMHRASLREALELMDS